MKRSRRTRRPHTLSLVDSDIESINRRPAVRIARRKLHKAIEHITHWRLGTKGGVPEAQFHLVMEYEDALGAFTQALIHATQDRIWQKLSKRMRCNTGRVALPRNPKLKTIN